MSPLPPPMSPPPQPLMEELVEEILLRFPPQEPASLVRASLVCKQWCRLISEPRFQRRFRELHRAPPMLGFLLNGIDAPARFVPTSSFCPPHADRGDWVALDARHGRVLLQDLNEEVLMVWDPTTGVQKELPVLPQRQRAMASTATILCAAAAGTCDHLDCRRGPFLVVFVGSDPWNTSVCTYASDADAWSETISTTTWTSLNLVSECTLLVGNNLYFGDLGTQIILKYNLETPEMSWIWFPDEWCHYALTTMEEGRLGLVTVVGYKLYVWLRMDAREVDAGWAQTRVMWVRKDGHELDFAWAQARVIELETLLPRVGSYLPRVVGFADGLGTVFLEFDDLLYIIDLKTYNVKKLCQTKGRATSVVPYMSFCIPALGGTSTSEGPSASCSSA